MEYNLVSNETYCRRTLHPIYVILLLKFRVLSKTLQNDT